MIVRQLLTQMGYVIDEKSEKKTESSIDGLKSAAKTLAAIFVTGAVAVAIRKFVNQGSDAAETMNVLTETFEDQASAVTDWAADQSTALGRSEFLLREYAGTLGAILKPQLGSAEAAAEMSTALAGLAVDLGSFFNATEIDTLGALRSGIVGQSEPLRRFGVVMSVAALDAFALEEGLGKTVKQMSEGEKVALRFRFIMSQTAAAQGDAAKTSQGFANLSKALDAALSDLGTRIGLELLPFATKLLQVFVAMARAISGPLLSAVQRSIVVIRQLATGTNAIIVAIAGVVLALKALGVQAVVTWIATTIPALLFIALLGLIGLAIFAVIEDLEAMGEGGESVIGGLISEFQRWQEQTGSTVDAIGEILKTAFLHWLDLFLQLFGMGLREESEKLFQFFDEWMKDVDRLFSGDFSKIIANAKRDFRDLTSAIGFGGTQTVLQTTAGASPIQRAAAGVSVQQNIEVNAQGSPGMNEGELAQMIGNDAGRATAAVNRQTANQLSAIP